MCAADRKEFIKISQAIAMGFVAMGTVGYLVKLSTFSLDSTRTLPTPSRPPTR